MSRTQPRPAPSALAAEQVSCFHRDGFLVVPRFFGRDEVFFDSFVPHRSSPNTTDVARRVLYVTYNRHSAGDQRDRDYADKHARFPPDIERVEGREYVYRV